MAFPKKKTTSTKDMEKRINHAVDKAAGGGVEEKVDKPTEKPLRKTETAKKQTQNLGRPSPRQGKTTRHTFVLTEKTSNRFEIAFTQESLKAKQEGQKIDKSLFHEKALVEWLDKNKY